MRSMFIVGVLTVGTVCAAQAPPAKKVAPARKTPARQSTFVCPDAEAQQGCKSYEELVRAKDKGLPINTAYICFRKKVDEFFVFMVSTPYPTRHWDEETKQMVLDQKPAFGNAQTYKNGVLVSTTMPTFNFSGQWKPSPFSKTTSYFTSDQFNFQKKEESDHDQGVFIDETQVSVDFKYQNPMEKAVRYTLIVQKSTGRFAESFRIESEKIPFSESTGYCVYH